MDIKQLESLKQKITSAKEEVSELKGKKSNLMSNLKDKWGCNSLKEAKEKLKTFSEERHQLQQEIDDKINELEENYDLE